MGGKKPPAKKSEEEKLAEKRAKQNTALLKAAKNDEVVKAEKAIAEGAEINFQNEHGQSASHMAAAYGALDVLRLLYKSGADFTLINAKKMTPLDAAKHIGEEDAQALIEALLAGKSGDEIGLGKDLDLSDEEEDDDAGSSKPGASKKTDAAKPAPAKKAEEVVDVSDGKEADAVAAAAGAAVAAQGS